MCVIHTVCINSGPLDILNIVHRTNLPKRDSRVEHTKCVDFYH